MTCVLAHHPTSIGVRNRYLLGIEASERTLSRFVRRRRRPPSQTWRTFLKNHLSALVSMDFFTVPTLTGRVLVLLALIDAA